MSENTSNQGTYSDLQNGIDRFVGKVGLNKAIALFAMLNGDQPQKEVSKNHLRLLTEYVQAQSMILFDLKRSDYFTNTSKMYREGRMASIYLIRSYTGMTFEKLGDYFEMEYYQTYYFNKECTEILDIPHCYKAFVTKLKTLETALVTFISNMTS